MSYALQAHHHPQWFLADMESLWDRLQDSPQHCKLTKIPPPNDRVMQVFSMVYLCARSTTALLMCRARCGTSKQARSTKLLARARKSPTPCVADERVDGSSRRTRLISRHFLASQARRLTSRGVWWERTASQRTARESSSASRYFSTHRWRNLLASYPVLFAPWDVGGLWSLLRVDLRTTARTNRW